MTSIDETGIPRFDRRFAAGDHTFTRIGDGALGGKAAGLWRVREEVLSRLKTDRHPRIDVSVPSLTVLCTDFFDEFMASNGLYEVVAAETRDDVIAHAFQKASLPVRYLGDLRALAEAMRTPLAVRSSSLLEDALEHPFAGVYATKMIPNNQPAADARYSRLVEAVKFVCASTFFSQSRSYLKSIERDVGDEKMAVIVQEIVGQRCDQRFYPGLSGVARSYNYYPTGNATSEDGVVSLALGLGKQIVDGGLSWTYCPARPKAPPPFNDIGDLLKNSQTRFWAVNMGSPPLPDPIKETEYMVEADLENAEYDGTLELLASTYDAGADRLRPGLSGAGPRLLNFAPMLEYDVLELNDLILELLEHAREASAAPVEIEFAMTTRPGTDEPHRFGFLQMRPMMVAEDEVFVGEDELQGDDLVLASTKVLGNGDRDDLRDVIYLKPDSFEAKHTPVMARDLEAINRNLLEAETPYVLMGFGRWGSSDPWLGVPIEWGDISGARVIVEASLPGMSPDLSQGSHFFHNLIGFRILYLSTTLMSTPPVDWAWLDAQPAVHETEFVRHVRTAAPIRIKVDGRRGRGVIRHG